MVSVDKSGAWLFTVDLNSLIICHYDDLGNLDCALGPIEPAPETVFFLNAIHLPHWLNPDLATLERGTGFHM